VLDLTEEEAQTSISKNTFIEEMAKYMLDTMDYIPVVGHIKGLVQKRNGNKEAAVHAFKSATRTSIILAAGAVGFFVGGPTVAAVCGTLTGIQWDLAMIIPSHGQEIKGVPKVIDEPKNLNAWIDGTVRVASDGITGVCGGKMSAMAKATKRFVVQPEVSRSPMSIPDALMYESETDDSA